MILCKEALMREAPNYTNAALIMGLVNLLWIFGLVWSLWGLPVVLLLAAGLNALIDRAGRGA
ncbi:MAG: hypothetical protein CML69_13435 [Rhodobacteraceae bacterium]|nr:hypothetical protein [Paracoccaceae bacterium]